MRHRSDGMTSFGICDFCETDSSASDCNYVDAIGDKGICDKCIRQLQEIIKTPTCTKEKQ
jgi:hypothetical protein